MQIPIKVVKMFPDAKIPQYKTEDAAGFDLHAHLHEDDDLQPFLNAHGDIVLEPGQRIKVPTGLKVAIPRGWQIIFAPRSGIAYDKGITVINAPGIIDADFRGELGVLLANLGEETFIIHHQDRIAQGILLPAPQAKFEETDDLDETVRGEKGFGSTGVA